MGEKYFVLGRLEQPRQNKNRQATSPTNQLRKEPFHLYSLESPFTSVSTVSMGHPSLCLAPYDSFECGILTILLVVHYMYANVLVLVHSPVKLLCRGPFLNVYLLQKQRKYLLKYPPPPKKDIQKKNPI